MATEPNTTKKCDNKEEATSPKFDIVGHLPLELAQKILLQLSREDLRSAMSCCVSWKAALSNDKFWKGLCEREGYVELVGPQRREFYSNFLNRYKYWQGLYWYKHILCRNWEANNLREIFDAILYCRENGICLVTTHKIQSLDIGVYGPGRAQGGDCLSVGHCTIAQDWINEILTNAFSMKFKIF